MSWTPERKELAKKLWAEGKSASQIAAVLRGVSRNAVIGVIHRAGMAARAKPSKPKAAATRPGRPIQTPTTKPTHPFLILGNNAVAENAEPRPIKTPSKANAFDALLGSTPRPFWERPPFGCKWPIGEEAWSCCLRSETGRYCPEHERMSRGVQPKAKTGNELARSLRRYA